MTARNSILAATFLVAAIAPSARAQERGGFVTTLGRDTVAVERFTRSSSRLEGEVVLTSPRVVHAIYSVALRPDGTPSEFNLEQHIINDTVGAVKMRIVFGDDSVRHTRTQGTSTRYSAAPGEHALFVESLYYWALYELESRATTAKLGDSTTFHMVAPSGPKPYPVTFRRRAADTLSTKFFYPEYWMNYVVARSGKLLLVDGARTTIKVQAARTADAPIETFVASAAAKERSKGPMGAMSRSDSISTVLGAGTLSLAYSRPEARGRKIWGGVVPNGEIWRTGANAATRLHLSSAVEIGGSPVPAGDYTIFSLPTATGATLIINKQVGQWGTEYHPEQDLVRIPVKVDKAPTKIESFTMRFEPIDARSQRLIIEWDDAKWSVIVGVAK